MNSTMDILSGMKLPEDVSITIKNISRNILLAEYDEALALIKSLLPEVK